MPSHSLGFRSIVYVALLFIPGALAGCSAHEAQRGYSSPPVATTGAGKPGNSVVQANSDRKIIYTAQLQLAVKSFAEVESEIKQLLRTTGGQVAEFREDRSYGNRRGGLWKVRVPPAKFSEFIDRVAEFGVPQLREVRGADVTEEYVDIEARLKNKRQLEIRILKLLEEKTGEIRDVVAVETELARIREEIERIEGRLRLLASQVELATVTIHAFEREEYTPPTAPTFRDRLALSFYGSLRTMRACGEGVAILAVTLAPWLLLLAIAISMAWFLATCLRRLLRRNAV